MAGETKIHFLNVGHGDCTVIKHPSGRLTVIDTSNAQEVDESVIKCKIGTDANKLAYYNAFRKAGFSERRSLKEAGVDLDLTNPVEFIKTHYPNDAMFRYIQTHPEMDHMRGLSTLDSQIGVSNFWDTKNHRPGDSISASDEPDWRIYQTLRTSDKVRHFVRGSHGKYYSADDDAGTGLGDGLEILSPSSDLVSECDSNDDTGRWNEISFVIRLTHGPIRVIFGGDAGEKAWTNILTAYPDDLKCRVLKASHHGRKSGYVKDAVSAMAPQISILSIGEECEHEAYDEYKNHSKFVWSTYERGNITLTLQDDGHIIYSLQHPE